MGLLQQEALKRLEKMDREEKMMKEREYQKQKAEMDNRRLDQLRKEGKASTNNHFHTPVCGGTDVHTEETIFLGQAFDSEWELIYRKNTVFTNILFYEDQYGNKQVVIQHFEGTDRAKENLRKVQEKTN